MPLVSQTDYTIGAPVTVPPSTQKSIICDTDGSFKVLDSTGVKTSIGGSGGGDPGTLYTVGSNVQNYDINPPFAGDTDGDYEIAYSFIADSASASYFLQPNGADPASCKGSYIINNSGAAFASGVPQTSMFIGQAGAGLSVDGVLRVSSKSGRTRFVTGSYANDVGITGWFSYWDKDTATVFTSFRIHSDHATGIQTNSKIRIRKLGFTA